MFIIHDNTKAVVILTFDFRKAFEKIPNDKLIIKARALGALDEVANWIKDWFSDKIHRVVIK